MLISKAIRTAMGLNLSVTSDDLEFAAIKYGLDPNVDFAQADQQAVNAAAASALTAYLMINSESEGGFSVSLNTKEIENRIIWLAGNSGGLFPVPPNLKPKRSVRAVNRW